MSVHLSDPTDPLRLVGCRCPRCRYDLKGATRCRCPECGEAFVLRRVREARLHESEASTVIGWVVVFAVALALLFGAWVFHRSYWGGGMAAMMAGSAAGLVIVAAAWKALT